PPSVIYYEYNTSGLVTEVKKNNVSLVKFYYNERGQRVKKESFFAEGPQLGSLKDTYYYVRDVSGNPMAIYKNSIPKEYPVYGSGRLGIFYKNTPPSGEPEGAYVYQI